MRAHLAMDTCTVHADEDAQIMRCPPRIPRLAIRADIVSRLVHELEKGSLAAFCGDLVYMRHPSELNEFEVKSKARLTGGGSGSEIGRAHV